MPHESESRLRRLEDIAWRRVGMLQRRLSAAESREAVLVAALEAYSEFLPTILHVAFWPERWAPERPVSDETMELFDAMRAIVEAVRERGEEIA